MRCLSLPKRDGSPRSWRSTTPLCMAVGSTWLRSNSRYWLANVYRTASQRSLRCKSALLFGSLNAIRLRQASTGVLRRPMPASSSSISIQLSNEGGQSTRHQLLKEVKIQHTALQNVFQHVDYGETVRTPHGIARVWPEPGKEPAHMVHGSSVPPQM